MIVERRTPQTKDPESFQPRKIDYAYNIEEITSGLPNEKDCSSDPFGVCMRLDAQYCTTYEKDYMCIYFRMRKDKREELDLKLISRFASDSGKFRLNDALWLLKPNAMKICEDKIEKGTFGSDKVQQINHLEKYRRLFDIMNAWSENTRRYALWESLNNEIRQLESDSARTLFYEDYPEKAADKNGSPFQSTNESKIESFRSLQQQLVQRRDTPRSS